jgi:RNase H-fold protein (predicted Holliday junction resolvase)
VQEEKRWSGSSHREGTFVIRQLTFTSMKTILGIDPGTKEMGIAVLKGHDLVGYGVYTLRNGERPHDVIGQAKRIVLQCIAKYAPDIVAIEQPLPIPTKRVAVLSVIAQELRER